MQCDRQFDDAKACSQMATGNGHRINGLSAQFVGNLLQVLRIDTSQICRVFDRIKNSGAGICYETIVWRRHYLITFPNQSEVLVPLAKPHGNIPVAPYELCRHCHEVSQLASIKDTYESSTQILLRERVFGDHLTYLRRRYQLC